jgi:hypothetical protein
MSSDSDTEKVGWRRWRPLLMAYISYADVVSTAAQCSKNLEYPFVARRHGNKTHPEKHMTRMLSTAAAACDDLILACTYVGGLRSHYTSVTTWQHLSILPNL